MEGRTRPAASSSRRLRSAVLAIAVLVFALPTEAPGTFQALVLNDPCVVDHPERGLCRELPACARSERARSAYCAVSHDDDGALGTLERLEALSAGHLHRVRGDTSTAIQYCQECLRRDPDMRPAREWIRRLTGGS